MNNWVIQDISNGSFYEITIDSGILNLVAATTPWIRNPIILDTDGSGTYWQLYSDNGVLTWNTIVSSGLGDIVFMYDTVLQQWFTVFISSGIQGEIASNGPLVTTATQPTASGSGVRSKRRRVRKLYLEFDIDGRKKFYYQWETVFLAGSKVIPVIFKHDVVAAFRHPVVLTKDIVGRRKYLKKIDLQIKATRKAALDPLKYDLRGVKMAPSSNDYWCFYGTRVIPRLDKFTFEILLDHDKLQFGLYKNRLVKYDLVGDRKIQVNQNLEVAGIKISAHTTEVGLIGKRDLTPILYVLDLLEI